MTATVIDGKAIAARMAAEVAAEAAELAAAGWAPRLVSISVGDVAAAELYVRNQRRQAEAAGVDFEARNYPDTISLEQLTGVLAGLNADPRVNGIIIQRPLPAHIPVKALQKAVHPLKDVEGMHPSSIGNIVYNDLALGPCTAVAAVEILKTLPLKVEGLDVCVIGHSVIVGKLIAFLMMGLGATVTVLKPVTGTAVTTIKLPSSALRLEGNATTVWVLDPATMTVKSQAIEVKTADGNDAVVSSGLSAGDQVVMSGVHVLTAGQKVSIFGAAK